MGKKEFIEKLKKTFYDKLQRKTGWGKDEVFNEFKDAIIEVVLEAPDER